MTIDYELLREWVRAEINYAIAKTKSFDTDSEALEVSSLFIDLENNLIKNEGV